MFNKKDIDFEKEQEKYEIKAKEYLNDPKSTEKLIKSAIQKANAKSRILGDVWERLQVLFRLVSAYSKDEYREVSNKTILTILGAVIYFVSPIDLIPDFIVGLGLFDDAAVIGYTIKKIAGELDKFQEWEKEKALMG